MRTPLAVAFLIAVFASLGGAAHAKPTPAGKCAAIKRTAVGQEVAVKLHCTAAAALQNGTADALCLAKAESKFAKTFAKAEAKHGCATTGDMTALEEQVDAFVNEVVGALQSAGTPTTTTVTSTTTSTTTPGPTCGDGTCDSPETDVSCAADCGCAAIGCGGHQAPGSCYCDAGCLINGDCCSDACSACNTCP
jgi:hypothetical protein